MHHYACRRRIKITENKEGERSEGALRCQASCGLFVTMKRDSNGDSVLEAMSLVMNSPTTISPQRSYGSAYKHARAQKKAQLLRNTHSCARTRSSNKPPPHQAPTAFSDLHLVLESAGTRVGPGWPAPSRHLGRVHATFNACLCSFPPLVLLK